jgi:hypothetical protein
MFAGIALLLGAGLIVTSNPAQLKTEMVITKEIKSSNYNEVNDIQNMDKTTIPADDKAELMSSDIVTTEQYLDKIDKYKEITQERENFDL